MKEEGIETIKSLVILTVLLGAAFTVAAMMPSDECCSEDFKPLEVTKTKVSGPTVLIIGTPGTWELEITVINNLEPVEEVVDEEVDNEPEDIVYYSTRGAGEARKAPQIPNQNTVTDVVVKDQLPSEFELMEFTPTQGDVFIEASEDRGIKITWNVGNLDPKASATLNLVVATTEVSFSKPGNYVINSGASATGLLYSTQEILTDGPTKSILLTVTDGVPNDLPIAEAGIDQMTFEGNQVYLDGSGSYDPDGMVVEYVWYAGEERIGSTVTLFSYLSVGVHEVRLEVKDNDKATASDTVTITIYETNAEMEGGVLTGVVRDATTRRGFDPLIVVSNGDFEISTWTDFEGTYKIIGIPEGHYDVECFAEGYQDFHGQVYFQENEELTFDIYMERE